MHGISWLTENRLACHEGLCCMGWVSEWVSEWVSGWVSEWVSEWASEWVGELMSEWVSEWVSEWLSEWVSEWVSKWVALICFSKYLLKMWKTRLYRPTALMSFIDDTKLPNNLTKYTEISVSNSILSFHTRTFFSFTLYFTVKIILKSRFDSMRHVVSSTSQNLPS
jgi:hypothetical protein